MQFQNIANACGIFTSDSGVRILTDPWIVDGVFDGSWCHFHPLETTLENLQDVDAIYVSHLHPDHYDPNNFNVRKDIPIFILNHGINFLHKNLSNAGFTNLILIKDKEKVTFKDYEITMFAEFSTHNFADSTIGTLIDSGIILESNGVVAFNPNDNKPDIKSCLEIKEQYGHIDLVLLNSNAAGPYPACFDNLSDTEKLQEKELIEEKYMDYGFKCIQILEPSYVVPFAGFYALGGSQHHKNKYLASLNPQECAEYLNKRIDFNTSAIPLRENDVLDIKTGIPNRKFIPFNSQELYEYAHDVLSLHKYDHEEDDLPDMQTLVIDAKQAALNMQEKWKKFNYTPDMELEINVEGEKINICKPPSNSKGVITCSLDSRLLRRVLNKESNWNNAEIGCHVDFNRTPNYFSPDLHTMMAFFHL